MGVSPPCVRPGPKWVAVFARLSVSCLLHYVCLFITLYLYHFVEINFIILGLSQ